MRYPNCLRPHREALGITQWQVAKHADLTLDRYGRLETGKAQPTFDEARRLAAFFTVDPDELFPAPPEVVPPLRRGRHNPAMPASVPDDPSAAA